LRQRYRSTGQENRRPQARDPERAKAPCRDDAGCCLLPFKKKSVKFAIATSAKILGNPFGGAKQSAVYEDRINFAVDADLDNSVGLKQIMFQPTSFRSTAACLAVRFQFHESQRPRGVADDPAV
jgi:porin